MLSGTLVVPAPWRYDGPRGCMPLRRRVPRSGPAIRFRFRAGPRRRYRLCDDATPWDWDLLARRRQASCGCGSCGRSPKRSSGARCHDRKSSRRGEPLPSRRWAGPTAPEDLPAYPSGTCEAAAGGVLTSPSDRAQSYVERADEQPGTVQRISSTAIVGKPSAVVPRIYHRGPGVPSCSLRSLAVAYSKHAVDACAQMRQGLPETGFQCCYQDDGARTV